MGKPVTSARGLLNQSMAAPAQSINIVNAKPLGSTPGMTTGGVVDAQQ